jgi:hypothetical protein
LTCRQSDDCVGAVLQIDAVYPVRAKPVIARLAVVLMPIDGAQQPALVLKCASVSSGQHVAQASAQS